MTTKYQFYLKGTVYQGCRYWKQDDLEAGERPGWNVDYEPYQVVKITPKRLIVQMPRSGYPVVHLNRSIMERDGLQYHSRFSEYFFAHKPNIVGDYIGMSTDAIQASFDP